MNSKKLITIVSDTSPVISLASIDRIDILEKLFKKIIIPRAVWNEFTAGENELETNKLKSFFRERVADISQTNNLLPIMDLGESEAIILYKELKADFLVIDDLKARQIAEELGVNCVGTLGILFKAKEKGLIKELRTLFIKLIENNRYYSKTILNKLLDLSAEKRI